MSDRRGCELRRTVVLIGMMGCGKSTVGRRLAACIGAPFCDSDAEIERAANMTIAEIFSRDGEDFFRRREAEVMARLLKKGPCVLAAGGGSFMNGSVRDLISSCAASLWLDVDPDLLWRRVGGGATRPLLHSDDPEARLRSILEERRPVYEKADIVVRVRGGRSVAEVADLALGELKRGGIVAEADQ